MNRSPQKRISVHTLNDGIKRNSSGETNWEVLLDDKWTLLRSATKLRDNPGTEQNIVQGTFWYALKFNDDGISGSQKNISTGKVRPLRRVQQRDDQVDEQLSIPAVQQASQPAGQACHEADTCDVPYLNIPFVSVQGRHSQTTAVAPPSTKSTAEGATVSEQGCHSRTTAGAPPSIKSTAEGAIVFEQGYHSQTIGRAPPSTKRTPEGAIVSQQGCHSQTTAGATPSTKSPAEGACAPRIVVRPPSQVCTAVHCPKPLRLSTWYPNLLSPHGSQTKL
jgi:hypothetical protein